MNKKNIKNFYCFRHGQTDWNKAHRFQGTADIGLNEVGRAQAQELIPLARQLALESVYASPLKRAFETAQLMVKPLKLEVISHPGLKEIDMGLAEGLTESEILQQFGMDALDKWRSAHADHDHFGFPKGEKKILFRKRAILALSNIAEVSSGNNIAIVSHGYFVRQLFIAAGGIEDLRLKNAEMIHFTYHMLDQKLNFIKRVNVNELENGRQM